MGAAQQHSQYSALKPTTPDKIENFHAVVLTNPLVCSNVKGGRVKRRDELGP